MASPAQVAASRANGQLSNGPRSLEGKAISSRNSLKLGLTAQSMIIPGEDPAQLDQLTAEYEAHYQPVGPVETALLQQAIRAQWMLHRYYRIEAEVINLRAAAHPDALHAVGAAFHQDAESGNALLKIFRRQRAAERSWHRALELLQQLRNSRRRAAEFQAELLAGEVESRAPEVPWVRFDNSPQPSPLPAPEPPVNLALRL